MVARRVYRRLSAFDVGAIQQKSKETHMGARKLAKIFAFSPSTIRRALSYSPDTFRQRRKSRVPDLATTNRRALVKTLACAVVTVSGVRYPRFPSAPSIAAELAAKHGTVVHPSTVWRDAKAEGLVSLVRPKVPTREPHQIQRRLNFLRRNTRSKAAYNTIVFSDETMPNTNDFSDRRQFVKRGKQPLPRQRKKEWNTARVHAWGAVGIGYKSPLIFLPKTRARTDADDAASGSGSGRIDVKMNGDLYKRVVLQKVVGTLRSRVLMQDGARCHWRRDVVQYLAGKGVPVLNDWPAHSPDLNPVECVWGMIQSRVGRRHPSSEAQLRKYWAEEWEALTQAEVDGVVEGHWRRWKEVLRRGGNVA